MAILPAPKAKPGIGLPGQFQNMEEWNGFTAFVTGTTAKAIGFGHPVSIAGQAGDGTALVKALADGEVFAGITRENISTGNATDQAIYADNDRIGVADEGVILVVAGAAVSKGEKAFWNPADNKYYDTTDTGRLPLPNCEFDQDGTNGNVVPLRFRIVPGGSAVTAG